MMEDTAPALSSLKKMFDDYRATMLPGRQESIIDIDYYDGKQLTPAQRRALKRRKQPDIVINRTRAAINGTLGVVQRGRSEPRGYPRTPKDAESADVATDALRFIADHNRFAHLKLDVFKDILVPGTGAALIGIDDDRQITVEPIRWEEFFHDPASRRADFSDARYMGIAKWMAVADLAPLIQDEAKRQSLDAAVSDGGVGGLDDTFQDRPSTQPWVDRRSRRVMVVELYHRVGGRWMRCLYYAGGVIEYGASPYQDERGRPCCPIEAQSAYVDRENNRYGAVRDMRGIQDEINQRRSKALHWLNVRQIQEAAQGAAMVDVDAARLEAARPDGVIPPGWQVVPGYAQAMAGNLEMMQEAKGEMERMSPNPAILGRDGADASGRAILARQQSGLVELAVLFGSLDDWELRVYRQMWARARQFWTAPMWVRVTDDEGAPRFVGLNQPKGRPVVHPPVTEDGQPHPMAGQPVVDPATGEPQEGPPEVDQATGQPVLGYRNQIAEMDVDIILDTTPDTANVQQEQFRDLMQAISANPAWAQQVPLDMMLQLSTIPHKKDLLDTLKQYREQQAQAQAQAAQQAAEMAAAEAASKIKLNDATANNKQADTELMLNEGLLRANQAGEQSAAQSEPAAGDTGAAAA